MAVYQSVKWTTLCSHIKWREGSFFHHTRVGSKFSTTWLENHKIPQVIKVVIRGKESLFLVFISPPILNEMPFPCCISTVSVLEAVWLLSELAAGPQAVICCDSKQMEASVVLWRILLVISLLILTPCPQTCQCKLSQHSCTVNPCPPLHDTEALFDASTVSKQSCLSGFVCGYSSTGGIFSRGLNCRSTFLWNGPMVRVCSCWHKGWLLIHYWFCCFIKMAHNRDLGLKSLSQTLFVGLEEGDSNNFNAAKVCLFSNTSVSVFSISQKFNSCRKHRV